MLSEPEKVRVGDVCSWLDYLMQRDSVEGAQVMVDIHHHHIHEGDHYIFTVFDDDVDVAAPKIVRVVAPDTGARIHLMVHITADGAFLWEFYENPTVLAAGNARVPWNSERNSTNATTMTAFEDSTTQAPNNDGTLLTAGFGGAHREAGASGTVEEWVLKQGEEYIIKVTVAANDTQVSIMLELAEHSA